ncbi:MAG: type II toxin-antitoxin system HicA family toxin [Acidobacteria bacterium]|nr:type II toxin-antitoxin system HicA family toxin [Acidobacteriota bacterium]
MPLNPLPFHEVCRRLRAAGFSEVSQKGSHVKFSIISPDGTRIAIVPKHAEVKVGTIRSILRQAGITPEEWDKL